MPSAGAVQGPILAPEGVRDPSFLRAPPVEAVVPAVVPHQQGLATGPSASLAGHTRRLSHGAHNAGDIAAARLPLPLRDTGRACYHLAARRLALAAARARPWCATAMATSSGKDSPVWAVAARPPAQDTVSYKTSASLPFWAVYLLYASSMCCTPAAIPFSPPALPSGPPSSVAWWCCNCFAREYRGIVSLMHPLIMLPSKR